MLEIDYTKLMEKLLAQPVCALFTTGRTGTDFLQSLFDGHPDVLLFNGNLRFHEFWENSRCVAAGRFDIADLIDEFIGEYIYRFKSRYDLIERKDMLGDDYNQTIDVDTLQFKCEVKSLLAGREITSRTVLIAIYAGFAICLGQNIDRKKLIFHHPHNFDQLGGFLSDFPKGKIIVMTRDPRANFVSGIEHHRRYNSSALDESHIHFFIDRILTDATVLNNIEVDYVVIRLEDLGSQQVLRKLCEWLEISYDECLTRSTWDGIAWHGDRLSEKVNREPGWSSAMIQNNWESRLSKKDKYVLEFLMYARLRHYRYSYREINFLDSLFVFFLIPLPLKYELVFFSWPYISSNKHINIIILFNNCIAYARRVQLFFQHYIKVLRREKFNCRFLSID